MFLFKTVKDLQLFLEEERKNNKVIGFAPTMGALHQGHLSLVEKANQQCDISVVSIFVNPTQFNDAKDLEKYPRTLGKDIDLLSSANTTVLFAPSKEEVYPEGLDTSIDLDFGELATVMEGAFRPGHFDGMAQVVNRLLNIVAPDKLFMGQKDFQQLSIVRDMLRQQKSKIELIGCPIVREDDGLAMSSRNRRLSSEYREKAPTIHQILLNAKSKMEDLSPLEVQEISMKALKDAGFKPEYFDIVDGITLQSIKDFNETDFIVALTAAWAGEIRLIDNEILKLKA